MSTNSQRTPGTGRISAGRTLRGAALAGVIALAVSGCGWQGLNSLSLPGAEGRGDGAWQITIEMPDVTTITMNSPVRVNDVNVGSITAIRAEDYTAIVDVSLDRDVKLPANAYAKIGQTSLLGSQHLELLPPLEGQPSGQLQDGDRIPIERAGLYPTTEQTLSALSVVLTNGGLQQFEQIADELNQAFDGRQVDANEVISELKTTVEGLDDQREDIVSAMEGIDRLTRQVNAESDTLARALREMPEAMELLNEQRDELSTALTSLGDFGFKANQVIDAGGDDLVANLENLTPVLEELANSGRNLTRVLNILITFPFPQTGMDHFMRSDFANLYIDVDLSWSRLQETFFLGTDMGNRMSGLEHYVGIAPNSVANADPFSLEVPQDPGFGFGEALALAEGSADGADRGYSAPAPGGGGGTSGGGTSGGDGQDPSSPGGPTASPAPPTTPAERAEGGNR